MVFEVNKFVDHVIQWANFRNNQFKFNRHLWEKLR